MKKVIITVDTESHIGSNPVERLIMGKLDNGVCAGIPLIMDICEQHGTKGLFFVDFAEAWDYGEESIKRVVDCILDRGHDIGMHIHPDHIADKRKLFLSDYSYNEQYEIINRCTDLYEKMVGRNPLAFRAGKYGANRETLDILTKLDYKADFSEFYGYEKWCHILPPVTGNESVEIRNGLLEFPVMSYKSEVKGVINRYDKLDINESPITHKYLLKKYGTMEEVNVISLFLHSFSFLHWKQNPENPKINKSAIKTMHQAMKQITYSTEMEFADLNTLLQGQYRSEDEINPSVLTLPPMDALALYIVKSLRVLRTRLNVMRGKKSMGISGKEVNI